LDKINDYLFQLIDQYKYPIAIVNLDHQIIFLNKSAKEKYAKRGKTDLENKSLFKCHQNKTTEKIKSHIEDMENGLNEVFLAVSKENQKVFMVAIRDKSGKLIGYYERFEDIHNNEVPKVSY
jgi:hypothetical protein